MARANGRFPRADRLIEDPRDPDHLLLAATYGILTTHDRGQSWYHICEASFAGIAPYVGDPLLDLIGDGSMLVDVQSSLRVSIDQGCTWSPTFGGPGYYLPDFTVARTSSQSVFAIYAVSEGATVVNRLIESTDEGNSFHILGTPLPVGVAFTVDVAAANPRLIYVSGLSTTNEAVLAVSADRGSAWITETIPLGTNETPYIAAVDPHDPRKIFLRVAAINEEDGVPAYDDALLVTTDGGASWREVFRRGAQATGFALSPDGDTVLIGYGDPRSDVSVDPSALGIYRSDTTNFEFSRLSTTSTSCLAWSTTGIYVCTSHIDTGHVLAFAPAASFSADGQGLKPLLYLGDVRGPLVCCAGEANRQCEANWSATCSILGACRDGASSTSGNTCDSDAQTPPRIDAGLADVRVPIDEDAAVGSSKDTNTGCGCRTAGMPRHANAPSVASLLAVFAVAVRRRRIRRKYRAAPLASTEERAHD